MSRKPFLRNVPGAMPRALAACLALLLAWAFTATDARATIVTLADQPVFAGVVPGNLALTLSVEFPTAISVANLGDYADTSNYLGYFDPLKCYTYIYSVTSPTTSYFKPAAFATGSNHHLCSGYWSGNFMNWATMQTIDPFRWALTGGYRVVDSPSQTIIEKAFGSYQGGLNNFPYRGTTEPTGNSMPSSLVSQVTPFPSWTSFTSGIWGFGNTMLFLSTGFVDGYGQYTGTSNQDPNFYYFVYVRVDVCDATTSLGVAGLESNCVQYANGYKPQGLLQQYSNQIRYGAFSYLNQNGYDREGGVLRKPMDFIGPTYPQPTSSAVLTNPRAEWDPTTGVMLQNPDTASASASGVTQSGVMNYLNKFGEASQTYMTYDDVSELYYAALRYYENLGNVSDWTAYATPSQLDGFPAVTTWTDPILYKCQKNFILGIGDDHTWFDYNVGGSAGSQGRPVPAAVSADTFNKAATWTTELQTLEGINPTPWWPFDSGATYYIAGLAYGAHVLNLRPDLTGAATATNVVTPVTVSTYWMDVAEDQEVENLNPYYLATKYGGFAVPSGYTLANTTPLPQSEWDTSGNSIVMNGGNSHPLPDNYFVAGNAGAMVAGLKSAFSNIATAIKAYTTSFSLPVPQISTSGTTSFGTQYDPNGWTGTITASTLTFLSDGTPSLSQLWTTDATVQAQLAGTGWNTGRFIATWNGSSGVPFRSANLASSQLAALTPSYSTATSSATYLNYLRGDQTNEVGSTAAGGSRSLRTRKLLLGDIVDAQLTPVATPSRTYSEANDPGYAAFMSNNASRPTMVYAGANDGMLHGFVGSTGAEQFAYIPSALFQGPNGTPQVDGLAQLGNPNYVHHYYVDATPLAFDIDLNNAGGTFGTTGAGNSNWHTLLIGGLGKGGKSYYALDVTNPAGMNTETAVAGKVMWEFTDSTMGYSYGAPVVVKTAKYGWVVALTSGYNNSDGYGYLYLVNPRTGTLLEKIKTPSASNGMTQASGYVKDYTDYTADSIYVGDLNGQLWRFDLTEAKGNGSPYPAPTLLAVLTDSSGNVQPITTAPLIEIHPSNRRRYIMVGTGQLLSSLDLTSTSTQSFYAILDGSAGAFNAVSVAITPSNLTLVPDVLAGITLTATSKGWYINLNAGYRVVINPIAYNGIVSFAGLLPQGDACSSSRTSQVYAVNYSTGKTVLNATSSGVTSPVGVDTLNGAVIELGIVKFGTNNPELIAGTSAGSIGQIQANLVGTYATRILNWREIPTAD